MASLRSFFSRKPPEEEYPALNDYSGINTDIHSHLIPGIDDGVKDLEESLAMISGMAMLGYRKLVTTPHIMGDFYRNTPEVILSGLEVVREEVRKAGIPVTIEAAAEYYLDEDFLRKIYEDKLLTIGGKYLLFEISYINVPDNLYNVIFEMNLRGYKPLMAHPERYPFWFNKFEEYHKLKDAGVLFQLNLNSLCGYYGIASKKIAERMIDEQLIDFTGTDLHGQRHLEALQKSLGEKHLRKLVHQGVKNTGV
jgi:protein-tyrosine phosphatase